MEHQNIGILSRFPEETITDLIESGFMERLGMDGSFVCFPRSRMHARAVANYLKSNHISVLILGRDFRFEVFGEQFSEDAFLDAIYNEVLVLQVSS